MGNLSQLDLRAKGAEFRVRALLEDLVESYKGVNPGNQLALALWFGKESAETDHKLLMLFTGPLVTRILKERLSLLWKTGHEEPPFVNMHVTTVGDFTALLTAKSAEPNVYVQSDFDVLYFNKRLLSPPILSAFHVVTEPNGFIKGWYLSENSYKSALEGNYNLLSLQQSRPSMGVVKVFESPDSEDCRVLFHVEVNQVWVPVSFGALGTYSFYNDLPQHPGYFLLQGGALYQILKVEVKTCPEYSERVLEKLPDDRYPEIYLRAVHQSSKPAA